MGWGTEDVPEEARLSRRSFVVSTGTTAAATGTWFRLSEGDVDEMNRSTSTEETEASGFGYGGPIPCGTMNENGRYGLETDPELRVPSIRIHRTPRPVEGTRR